ncbi:MAG: transglycosylase domain-containing protein, partial [Phycicoccus sp.]
MSQAVPRTRAEAGTRADQPPSGRTRTGGVRLPWWRTWLRRAGWAALAVVLLGIVGIGIAYAMIDVPDANESATAEASIVYFSDGKTEMARLSDPEGNRESVELRRVPEHVQNAFLAAEDKDFYENSGVSPTGIARAVWVAVKGGEATQGGSTITQQYVKNYFLTSDRTIQRKAREILLAVKIGREQSKQEILGNYLNTIYFGRGAYGIQTASKAYFGKDVSTLTPAEGAFLATVIRGPSLYDPGIGKEQAA